MRKTKIVCTLGPATDREGVLRQMLEAGMNVARFNFSHGSHAEHKGRLDALKALRAELGLPVAVENDVNAAAAGHQGAGGPAEVLRRRLRHAADRPGVHPDHPGHRGG